MKKYREPSAVRLPKVLQQKSKKKRVTVHQVTAIPDNNITHLSPGVDNVVIDAFLPFGRPVIKISLYLLIDFHLIFQVAAPVVYQLRYLRVDVFRVGLLLSL